MSKIKWSCPNCERRFEVPESWAKDLCPDCEKLVTGVPVLKRGATTASDSLSEGEQDDDSESLGAQNDWQLLQNLSVLYYLLAGIAGFLMLLPGMVSMGFSESPMGGGIMIASGIGSVVSCVTIGAVLSGLVDWLRMSRDIRERLDK